MTALCRFEMLLPLRFNDGTAVPADLISETIQELEDEFGAAQIPLQATGHLADRAFH